MNTEHKPKTSESIVAIQSQLDFNDMKAKLSTLWIFVFLNMIFRDLHEFGREGFLQEMMTGVVDGVPLTEELFLIAGIVLEVQIVMVVLSRVLPYRFNRWANIVVGTLSIGLILSFGANDLDDIWFIAIEVITLALIVWNAWRWHYAEPMIRSVAPSFET